MKYLLLVLIFLLSGCSQTASQNDAQNSAAFGGNFSTESSHGKDSEGEPMNTQIRNNGTYLYTIATPSAKVYTIKMSNGDICYVLEGKYSYSTSGISCIPHHQ